MGKAKHQAGAARSTRAAKASAPAARDKAPLDVAALRQSYGISRGMFARLLDVPEGTLARWEEGAGPPDRNGLPRLRQVQRILERAAGAMRPAYIPTWLETRSAACAEVGAHAPIDLMQRGDYDEVETLLFLLGSGVPF